MTTEKTAKPLFEKTGYWHGIKKAKYTACTVKLVLEPERPLWWQNAFAGTEIQAIEITFEGQTWMVANHDGTGYYKLNTGMGSPNVGHSSFTDSCKLVKYLPESEMITYVDYSLIDKNETIIKAYQKEKDPVEFARIESLRSMIGSFRK